MRSILDQNYPDLEYIVVDGGSTDGSVDIIRKYQDKLAWWCSEKDGGMYDALNKGFSRATGEVMGWINSDDVHHPGSLFTLGELFSTFDDVHWIQGVQSMIDYSGRIVYAAPVFHVNRMYFYNKEHLEYGRYIQQESTFWRRALWELAGGYMSTEYKLAGDFDLWIRFFKYARLHYVDALLGAFRLTGSGQASRDNYDEYVQETLRILNSHPLDSAGRNELRRYKIGRRIDSWLRSIQRKLRVGQLPPRPDIQFDPAKGKFRMM